MKKLLALVLALVMVIGMSACGQKDTTQQDPTQQGDTESTDQLSYPFKSITMIIPYNAGGTTDLVGRQLAVALGEVLNVSVVVENQGGASGAIGCQAALDAATDGSTILFTAESLGVQRVMGLSDLSYADFSPIMVTANDPKVIVVPADSEYDTIEDLLAAIQAAPNTIQMAYTGPGSSGHIQALILNKFGYVPALTAYTSGSDSIVAVMGKQVAFTNSNFSSVSSYIENGDLKMLAVCANDRMEQYPDVPALSEVVEGSEYYMDIPYCPLSLLVAKDVPSEVQETLVAACAKAVENEEFKAFMERNNIDKLYEKYTTVQEMEEFYSEWESVVSWLLYDAGAATYSPDEFNITKPAQ